MCLCVCVCLGLFSCAHVWLCGAACCRVVPCCVFVCVWAVCMCARVAVCGAACCRVVPCVAVCSRVLARCSGCKKERKGESSRCESKRRGALFQYAFLFSNLHFSIPKNTYLHPCKSETNPSRGPQAFKNTRRQLQSSLLVGLSPVHELLNRLRSAYGRYALFWADGLRADCIAVCTIHIYLCVYYIHVYVRTLE